MTVTTVHTAAAGALTLAAAAAAKRNEAMPHCLLTGGAGTGKTTLAHDAVRTAGLRATVLDGTRLTMGVLTNALVLLEAGGVIIIDEIHAVPKAVLESLLLPMESQVLQVRYRGSSITEDVQLPPWTLIATTTNPDRLPPALVSRFAHRHHLAMPSTDGMAMILHSAAQRRGLTLSDAEIVALTTCSRGSGRVARQRTEHYADYLDVAGDEPGAPAVVASMAILGIDADGLDAQDRAVLVELAAAAGDTVGVNVLAAMLGMAAAQYTEVVEPALVADGWVVRSGAGRSATPKARRWASRASQ